MKESNRYSAFTFKDYVKEKVRLNLGHILTACSMHIRTVSCDIFIKHSREKAVQWRCPVYWKKTWVTSDGLTFGLQLTVSNNYLLQRDGSLPTAIANTISSNACHLSFFRMLLKVFLVIYKLVVITR